jgi:hypothetical protein
MVWARGGIDGPTWGWRRCVCRTPPYILHPITLLHVHPQLPCCTTTTGRYTLIHSRPCRQPDKSLVWPTNTLSITHQYQSGSRSKLPSQPVTQCEMPSVPMHMAPSQKTHRSSCCCRWQLSNYTCQCHTPETSFTPSNQSHTASDTAA